MNHLNEDKLIQFAFDLMDVDEKQSAQQHLDTCVLCQKSLKQLQTRFTALDILAEEVPPSDELIRKTMKHSVQKPETEVTRSHRPDARHNIPLYRRRWVEWSAAAAAVVLICFLMLQNLPDTRVNDTVPTHSDTPVSKIEEDSQNLPRALPDDRMAMLSRETQSSMHMTTSALTGEGIVRVVSADEIPDKPPFAPASAIELVVLPKQDKTQVTIYNSADLTLVRDTRKLTLKPGWNWLQFMWDQTLIDPTSLSLTPLEYADKIDIQQLVYPARLKDIGRWLIRSEVEGAVTFEITYFASGLSWRAFYMGTMNEDETAMDLKGYVNVSNNSGQDFVNTQTRLIVGQTRLTEAIRYLAQRQYPYGPERIQEKFDSYATDSGLLEKDKGLKLGAIQQNQWFFDSTDGDVDFSHAIKKIEKTGLSEYFLYTIEGTEDLTNQWSKRLPSFDVEDVPVTSLYKYDEDRYGNSPVRFVSFVNDTEHELGETPIPEGSIKLYRNVNQLKNLSYVGESSIKYIPVNEDIELNLGPARLAKIEPLLIEQKTDSYTFDENGNINGWDDIQTWQIKLTNTRDIPVDVEITRNFGTDAWDLDLNSVGTAHPTYKKHDKNRARFTLTVPEKTETTFAYTVTRYQGRRSEAYVEKMKEQQE